MKVKSLINYKAQALFNGDLQELAIVIVLGTMRTFCRVRASAMRRVGAIVLVLSLLLIGQNRICLAQASGSGDIRGTVTDSTGAVIPGVAVTALNIHTGVATTVTTNGAGLFDTASIVLGSYKISFTKQGFSQLVRGPITVEAGYTTVNQVLSVGTATQKVTVNADLPLLDTESHEQSTTLQAVTLEALPETGQDWENFTQLIPGATGANSQGTTGNPGQNISANGNMPYANFTLDGSSTTLVNASNTDIPVLENVSELKIATSTFSAESGIGGIQFHQISKGGTNQFHGAAYEYFQNDAMNAANYGFGNNIPVTFLRYDNYGGAIGGPILKNRMFFYFNFDKTYDNSGASSGYATLPTDAVMSGDFTGFLPIYDPTTQVVTTVDGKQTVTRQSFADEYGNGNKIPSGLLDKVAQNVQAFYPTAANHPPTGKFVPGTLQPNGILQDNYYFSVPNVLPYNKYFGRLDYDLSSTNRITVSDNEQDQAYSSPSLFTCPIGCETYSFRDNNAQVSDVWTISPTFVNEFRYGFTTELDLLHDATYGKGYPQKLGLQFAKADSFPGIGTSGYTSVSQGTNAILKEFTYEPSDVVTLIKGRHILKFGGEFLMYINNATQWGSINSGNFSFSGNYTQSTVGDSASGVGYADFLLGQVKSWSASVTPEYGARYKSPQMFVQDDFKLKPNLTLNLGLRYTIQHGWNEVHGNMGVFDPTVLNPATGTLGAMWYGTTAANGRHSLEATVWDSVLPRLGFSWQPMSNTTVRGGYGLYDYNYTISFRGLGMGTAFASSGNASDQTNGISPIVILSSDGSNLPYVTAPNTPDALNGQTVNYTAYNAPDTKIAQWDLAVQRALGTNLVAELSYVGSHGYHLPFDSNLNQIPESKLSPTDSVADRPYPQYQGINTLTGNFNAISNYNGLEASITKRFSSGSSFSFNYTWSHFLDEMDSTAINGAGGAYQQYQNAYDPSANYGNSDFDVRHAFKGYGIYQLPFGMGRRYLNHNQIADGVIGGWNASGSIVLQTGNPFTPTVTNNLSYAQAGSWFPNLIGNPHLHNRSIYQWFNPAAYAAPTPGTFGNVHRNSLYGPGIDKVNLSLGKTFSIRENVKLEIRGDATNAFNHPSFGFPNSGLTCPAPGAACSSSNVTNIHSATVGGRTMQLGARLSF